MSPSSRARTPGRGLSWPWLVAACIAVAAPGLERVATAELTRADHCREREEKPCIRLGEFDVDIRGLRLADVHLVSTRATADIDVARVTPGKNGIEVSAQRLRGALDFDRKQSRTPTSRVADPPATRSPAGGRGDRWWSSIPVTVTAPDGFIEAKARGGTAIVRGPSAVITKDEIRLVAPSVLVEHPRLPFGLQLPLRASAARTGARDWTLVTHARLADDDGDSDAGIDIRAAGDRRTARLVASSRNGGQARIDIADICAPDRGLVFEASEFPLADLAPWLARVIAADTLHVLGGSLDGRARLRVEHDVHHFDIDTLTIAGLHLQSAHLARRPLTFPEFVLTGALQRDDHGVAGRLSVQDGPLEATVEGKWHGATLTATAELSPVACQDLLDFMPQGLLDVLEGAVLDGTVAAHGRIDIPATSQAETEEGEDAPPGTLTLDFPFLTACQVTRDPAVVDLEALRGPYRHRFRTDRGSFRERLLAVGSEGFSSLASVPLLAKAFITLEDSRFFRHDGFDREQMVRAFWHNIDRGRISRGASTITQQTARNLWLGGDRSLARKLQEAFLTARLEDRLSKARILELYLNVIELGPEVYGVQEAAQYHFGREPHHLDVLESVFLASLAPAPRALSVRFRAGRIDKEWLDHLHQQVRRMYMHHLISRDQLIAGLRSNLDLVDHTGK